MAKGLVIRIAGDSRKYQDALNKVKKGTADLENQLAKISRISGLAFAALTATVGLAVNEFAKFDNQIRGVRTLLDQTSFGAKGLEEGFADMRKEILEVATAFPVGIEGLNKALFDTVSAGIEAGRAVEVVAISAKLAVAGLTDVSIATDGMTSALNAYGLSADKAELVAAKFFTAQKFGKTTIDELSSSFGLVGATANAMGVSFEEVLGSVAAVTTAGVKTSAAFTGLKAVFANISVPTAKAAAEAEKLGVEFTAAALRAKGLEQFLDDLTESSEFTKDSVAALFGSVEAQNVIFALTGQQAGKFKEIISELGNEQKLTTTFTKAFNIQNDGLQSQMKLLGNAVSVAAIKIGEQFAPAVKDAVKFVQKLTKFVAENEGVVIGVTRALTFLIAALGGLFIATLAAGAIITITRVMKLFRVQTSLAAVAVRGLLGATGFGLLIVFLPEIIQALTAMARAMGLLAEETKTSAQEIEELGSKLVKLEGRREALIELSENQSASERVVTEQLIATLDREIEKEGQLRGELIATNIELEKRKVISSELVEIANFEPVTGSTADPEELRGGETAEEKVLRLIDEHNEEQEALRVNELEQEEINKEQRAKIRAEKERIEAEKNAAALAVQKKKDDKFRKDFLKERGDFNKKDLEQVEKNLKTEADLKEEIRKEELKREIDANNLKRKERIKFGKAISEINAVLRSQEVQAAKTISGELIQLQQSENSKLKSIGKVAALTQIAIDTATSAMTISTKVISAVPFPANVILAATLAAARVAFGAEQASKVTAARHGGVITGGIPGRDSVNALLQPGELVVPERNFEEVINAVRANREGDEDEGFGGEEPTVNVVIDISEDAANLITAQQNEDSALGISVANA